MPERSTGDQTTSDRSPPVPTYHNRLQSWRSACPAGLSWVRRASSVHAGSEERSPRTLKDDRNEPWPARAPATAVDLEGVAYKQST